jgi:hypothetical protein
MLLVSAVTLFVLALGTHFIRRYAGSAPSARLATQPLQAVDAGRVPHAKEERSADLDAGAAAIAKVAAVLHASALDAGLLRSSSLVDASAPLSTSARPDAALPLRSETFGERPASIIREGESPRALGAMPEKPARSSRRFRAGEARPSDF